MGFSLRRPRTASSSTALPLPGPDPIGSTYPLDLSDRSIESMYRHDRYSSPKLSNDRLRLPMILWTEVLARSQVMGRLSGLRRYPAGPSPQCCYAARRLHPRQAGDIAEPAWWPPVAP